MNTKRGAAHLRLLAKWFAPRESLPPEIQRGKELLAAIDAGGIPLNPAIVNRIARNLGLEVAADAPTAQTVVRIRAAVARATSLPPAGKGLR